MEDKPKPLVKHILELRSAILHSFAYVLGGMLVSFAFYNYIFEFLLKPVKSAIGTSSKIIYTSVAEPIATELRVVFYSGLLLTFPFVINNIWKFIKPGLRLNEYITIRKYMYFITVLFIIGIIFAYCIVVPNILYVLTKTLANKNNIMFLPKISENISFVIVIVMSFGFSFQLPLIMIILDKIKIIPFSRQKSIWREYIAVIVIISAIITPPDVLSMIFLAVPLILLYCLTLAYNSITSSSNNKKH
ncbi:MAG: twin-arginine translocase subunit TatC [Holosporales bacterium]|jgi:sec-independent protein translocase protein TatC|nr:twin-arginine translocase subunit TatC [Holosporales bacterium]